MDAGAPWTCAACGAGNAAYRRRCIECGDRRPASAATASPAGPGEIPMPRLARRRASGGRRWPAVLGVVAVLALAAYGVASYVGADRPSREDDLDALRVALDGGSPLGAEYAQIVYTEGVDGVRSPVLAQLTGCDAAAAADLGRREDELLYDAGENETPHLHAAYQDLYEGIVHVRLFAFRTAGMAQSYEALLVEGASSCGVELEAGEQVQREGRAVAVVAGDADTRPILERLAERLEIEG